jgi:hypothetical protein
MLGQIVSKIHVYKDMMSTRMMQIWPLLSLQEMKQTKNGFKEKKNRSRSMERRAYAFRIKAITITIVVAITVHWVLDTTTCCTYDFSQSS